MQFTLGIEEEYQVIDPETRELVSHQNKIVTEAEKVMANQATPEMHEAMVEVGTKICTDIKDARRQVSFLRKSICEIAQGLGYRIGGSRLSPLFPLGRAAHYPQGALPYPDPGAAGHCPFQSHFRSACACRH